MTLTKETMHNALINRNPSFEGIFNSINNPRVIRAVARANGDNRISILIPCHRVIGSDGSLTGYGGEV